MIGDVRYSCFCLFEHDLPSLPYGKRIEELSELVVESEPRLLTSTCLFRIGTSSNGDEWWVQLMHCTASASPLENFKHARLEPQSIIFELLLRSKLQIHDPNQVSGKDWNCHNCVRALKITGPSCSVVLQSV